MAFTLKPMNAEMCTSGAGREPVFGTIAAGSTNSDVVVPESAFQVTFWAPSTNSAASTVKVDGGSVVTLAAGDSVTVGCCAMGLTAIEFKTKFVVTTAATSPICYAFDCMTPGGV